ncbi:hypothetical protein ABI59_19930 [Acidobacteria bacterium Mor1]|nr:hypothetical protein ABI59_19930 [Acidobacteria bacterium Mor1]
MKQVLGIATLLTLVVLPSLAFQPVAVAAELPSGQEVTIEDFAWLAGAWIGEGFGGTLEEVWTPPRAGMMMGSFRHIMDGKVQFMEIVTLSEYDGEIQMRVKHFNSDLVAWEEKADFVTFRLESLTEERAKFDGLTIHRRDANKIQIDVNIRSGDTVNTAELFFQRYKLP